MTYEDFERKLLKLVYEDRVERLEPAFVAYALSLPHQTASSYLERATHQGLIDMEVTDEGRLEFVVPGQIEGDPVVDPVWRKLEATREPARREARAVQTKTTPEALFGAAADPLPEQHALVPATRLLGPADGASGGTPRADSTAMVPRQPTHESANRGDHARALAQVVKRRGDDEHEAPSHAKLKRFPNTLRRHIEARFSGEDGSVDEIGRSSAVLARGATVSDADPLTVSGELVRADAPLTKPRHTTPVRVEHHDEAFCDPSQTIFMRQLTVRGVSSKAELQREVERLFSSLGYRSVSDADGRLRFERGSVTFVLAMVPLFVLVLPLFIYLFLYYMGRSTIHQEPLELDVQMRPADQEEDAWELDLTFIGMHGVVLGAADQRVLNEEVDTLRDELQWKLTAR